MRLWRAATGIVLALATLGGCGSDEGTGTERVQMRLALSNPAPKFTQATVERTHEIVYVSPDVAMTGRDIQSAQVMQSSDGPAVGVQFTESGTDKLLQFTTENKGQWMAILLDGRVVVAPSIRGPIKDGRMLIAGKLSAARAKALAEALAASPRE